MVQSVEGSRVREDTSPELNKEIERIFLRHKGRKCYALVRNTDGKYYVGTAGRPRFTSNGKMYTRGLRQALDWLKNGSRWTSDGVVESGSRNLDMSEYTVIEYAAVEVERTPADEWMKPHGSKA